ncbi:hypothetical protein M0804_001828 [Polistes exclamans]|nr:hypothetical protein M0804_001828 [Polistes exclamans]
MSLTWLVLLKGIATGCSMFLNETSTRRQNIEASSLAGTLPSDLLLPQFLNVLNSPSVYFGLRTICSSTGLCQNELSLL